MRSLPVAFKSALESQEYIQAILITMTVVETTVNITSWNSPIIYGSVTYLPRGFDMHPVNYGSTTVVDDITVDIDDTDRGMYETLGEHDSGEYPIRFRWVILDNIGKVIASIIIFSGTIDHWYYEPGRMSVTAASIFNRWAQETSALYSESCRWKVFKGTECKYTGSNSSCDRTYDECDNSHGNAANFGGFRWLPSLVNKKVGGIT